MFGWLAGWLANLHKWFSVISCWFCFITYLLSFQMIQVPVTTSNNLPNGKFYDLDWISWLYESAINQTWWRLNWTSTLLPWCLLSYKPYLTHFMHFISFSIIFCLLMIFKVASINMSSYLDMWLFWGWVVVQVTKQAVHSLGVNR